MTTWLDSLQRRDEVKAAFVEAWSAGNFAGGGNARADAWKADWDKSEARKRLEQPLAVRSETE
jgi:hypothetical protein